ncbi:MAG: PilN domain-containing protein [Candidatus Omnitrophota bacterium]
MRRTNLIPQSLLRAQSRFTFQTQGEYFFFILCLVIFSFFLVLEIVQLTGIGIFAYQIKTKNNRLAQLSAQLSENSKARENIEAQLKSWRDKSRQTKERITFLENEVRQDLAWSAILEKLNSLVPARLWLVKLSLGKDLIKLKGNTYDNLLISTFISGLSNSNLFTDITLVYAQKNKLKEGSDGEAGREVIEFEITCRLMFQALAQDGLSKEKESEKKGVKID